MVSIGDLFEDLITLIRLKFYSKTESDGRYIQKNNTNGLLKNDGTVDQSSYLTSHQDISGKLDINQGSNSASKNVVTDSNGDITVEDKPNIPSASNTTPSMDTLNGSVGSGVTWARSNHTHPKSDLYAEATHSHGASSVTDSNGGNYTNIGTLTSNSTQEDINSAINTKLGTVGDATLTQTITDGDTTHAPSADVVHDALTEIDDTIGSSIALITGTTSPSTNLSITINASSFSTYSTTPFTYTGDLEIDWGDENTNEYSSGALSHTYSESGTYTILVKGNITKLNDECFKNNTSIIDITIPSSVTDLGEDTFNGCTGLTNIIIPSSVESIDENCFTGCSNLESISFEAVTPAEVENINAWTNLPTSCTLYVPLNSLNLYLVGVNYPNPTNYTYIGANRKSIDKVIDGELRAVTSNAVYDYIDTQLGDLSTIINGTGGS